ncbi:MAG: hypothetical protein VKO39_12785 [Cyanobacteriota bacterium]|nr:hypothetical protein [Cyanobacteriota bacterium]
MLISWHRFILRNTDRGLDCVALTTDHRKRCSNLDLLNIIETILMSDFPLPLQPSKEPSMELSISQRFEIERFSRAIDATADPEDLKRIAKQLLQAWQTQKAATNWVIGQQLGVIPSP